MTENEKLEMISYRIKRARETYQEVHLHIENKLWTTAINRLYYACYYAVSALLLKQDIKTQSHSGTRQMFGLHFIKTGVISKELGKFYSDIFDMRHSGDYDDFIEYTKQDVVSLLNPVNDLISKIEDIVK